MKTCTRCNNNLPLSEFSPKKGRPGQKNGYRSRCKKCTREIHRLKYNKSSYRKQQQSLKISSNQPKPNPNFKKCTKCDIVKPLDEFHPYCKNPTSTWHFASSCKECSKQSQKKYPRKSRPSAQTVEHILLESKRKRVKNGEYYHSGKHLPFTISIENIRELLKNQTKNKSLICAATGLELLQSFNKIMDDPMCPSIDRINNNIGYIPSNIRITSIMYNLAANNKTLTIPTKPLGEKEYKTALSKARSRARDRKGFAPNLDELIKITKKDNNGNFICSASSEFLSEYGTSHSPSLDRIDNKLGYNIENIRITSRAFNIGKNIFDYDKACNAWCKITESLKMRANSPHCFDMEWPILRRSLIPPAHKIRPQKLIISTKKNIELVERYHYLGAVNATHHICGYYNDSLVAYMAISKPTRQSSHDYEITRMVRDPNYLIIGVWSHLLNWIIKHLGITGEIVSFSDDRLFSGGVYEKMGFTHITNIPKDYYWYKNGKAYHKSRMRKTEVEKKTGKTEWKLREEQGYVRIYDQGKKKWILHI